MRENGRTWEVDYAGITRAKDALGIRLDVEIRLVGNAMRHGGRYRLRRRDGKLHHSITVSSWEDKQRAGEILWHELTHAYQAERDLGAQALADAAVARRKPTAAMTEGIRRRHQRVVSERARVAPPEDLKDLAAVAAFVTADLASFRNYWARPSEVEARAAEEFNDEIPLAKTRGAIALRPWTAPSVAEALASGEYRR